MNDPHASFDLLFRGESPSPFAYGLERMAVLGCRCSAWDTSDLGGNELTGGVRKVLGRTDTCGE